MKKFVSLFAVLSLIWPLPGSTATIISPGMDSCGTWTQARRSHGVAELNARAWIAGYLSAFNAAISGHLNVDILKDNIDGLWAWIDSFCRDHPLDTIQSAANGLGDELSEGHPSCPSANHNEVTLAAVRAHQSHRVPLHHAGAAADHQAPDRLLDNRPLNAARKLPADRQRLVAVALDVRPRAQPDQLIAPRS